MTASTNLLRPIAMLIALAAFSLSCSPGAEDSHNGDHEHDDHAEHAGYEEEDSHVVVNEVGGYGEPITADAALTVEQMVTGLADEDSLETKVRGDVTAVCQMSGCWMKMAYGDGDAMRVTFKDYGFFVPKDIDGEVVIRGTVKRKEVPVEELRHYAEDEGASEEEIEAITEPGWEYAFVADGVLPVEGE